ncbi:MAG TPA: glycosyltransferase family 4 protein, partial [Ilumatobacter sp.]|nr:glycosyltransferase family 4 protein [Ilumatobacter sp.]
VASAAAGTPDVIEDTVTGFVVPCRDSDALADRLLCLARDPQLSRKMGKAGRQRVLDSFDAQSWIDQYVRLYNELWSSRKEPTN